MYLKRNMAKVCLGYKNLNNLIELRPLFRGLFYGNMIKKALKPTESQQIYIKSLTNKAFLTQLGQ